MGGNWTFNETDRKLALELQDFLPERIFDAHNHIYRAEDLNLTAASFWTEGSAEVSIDTWRQCLAPMVSGASRLLGGLFFPVPGVASDLPKGNGYLLEQLDREPASRGLILVKPDDEPGDIGHFLRHPQVAGFKVYHVYSKERPTNQSSIAGFCPEWMWRTANERRMCVMLHMVRDEAVADPRNTDEINRICTQYPHMQLILAHAARCFHAPHADKGVRLLRGLRNVWFDMSAICEPEAIKVILREFGPRRLLWGSDFPVSQLRGKAVTLGDGFAWLDANTCNWEKIERLGRPALAGLESLRALKLAAEDMGLNRSDVADIFCDNALRLLRIGDAGGDSERTQELYRHAKKRIPGGVQLLSKRPENMAPDRWPAYYREARGCEIWDLDGKHYYDMSTNAVGACLLGYRDPDVTRAVVRRVQLGSMCSLNSPEEVELADRLCEIHPWAEQVRFARGGGESCAIAVRIARATTDRSIVAICGYHGWQDWYLAANLGEDDSLRGHTLAGLDPSGVPVQLRGTAVTFAYNDRSALQAIVDEYGGRLAAVIMEPCRNGDPEAGFLPFVREATRRAGALLIFDEVSIGWRLHHGGAHLRLGVNPDIAVFSKALGNGHPIGAVIGTAAAMQGAHGSFISSTYWTEGVGPTAALVTLEKLGRLDVCAHVERIGSRIADSWKRHGEASGLPIHMDKAYPCLAHFSFRDEQAEQLRTLYTQQMLERGFLAGTSVYPTWAHRDDIVDKYDQAIAQVFGYMAEVWRSGDLAGKLRGPVATRGFQRLI